MNSMSLSAPLVDSKTRNSSETPNCHQNLDVIALKPVNKLMIKRATTQPAPSSRPSKNLWGEQINIIVLYTYNIQFAITPGYKFWDQ